MTISALESTFIFYIITGQKHIILLCTVFYLNNNLSLIFYYYFMLLFFVLISLSLSRSLSLSLSDRFPSLSQTLIYRSNWPRNTYLHHQSTSVDPQMTSLPPIHKPLALINRSTSHQHRFVCVGVSILQECYLSIGLSVWVCLCVSPLVCPCGCVTV